MSVNVFEGARRIALASGLLWVGGWVTYAFVTDPNVSLILAVPFPTEKPVRTGSCLDQDASHTVVKQTPTGKQVAVTLCFVAHKADDGRMLVPYAFKKLVVKMPDGVHVEVPADMTRTALVAKLRADGADTKRLEATPAEGPMDVPIYKAMPEKLTNSETWLMGETLSAEVTSYARAVSSAFKLEGDSAEAAEQEHRNARLNVWTSAAKAAGVGLLLGWMMCAGLGWIVRGFLGIPRGQDARPNA